jgi:signal transduction histidine kinase
MLSAEDDFIKDHLDALRESGVIIRRIETPSETKFKMLIVDRKASFVVETKDDTRSQFRDAVGLATYSDSKATILPYVTIFESFWRETDLYEKAREADRLKDEFVNIAAHELKTPITPIISGTELIRETLISVKDKLDEGTYASLLDNSNMVLRNASRLHRLSEEILQVSRIEAGTFSLDLRLVDVDPLIKSVISDIERRYSGQKLNVKIVYVHSLHSSLRRAADDKSGNELRVLCDDRRISQVLYNILDNAMKFTHDGEIRVTSLVDSYDKEIVVSVRDPGSGLDPEIKPKLFEKFSAKSQGGTGLGLYLSKKIIDAHNGRIWAADNEEDTGTTFSFALPLDSLQEEPERPETMVGDVRAMNDDNRRNAHDDKR